MKLRRSARLWRAALLALCALTLTGCFSTVGARVETLTPGAMDLLYTPTPFVTQAFAPLATVDPSVSSFPTPTLDFAQPAFPTATPTLPPAVALVTPLRVAVALNVPVELQAALEPLLATGQLIPSTEGEAQVRLASLPAGAASPLVAQWVYVPVVRFGTVADNIAFTDMIRYWQGDTSALAYLTNGQPPAMVTTATIYYWMTLTYGVPAPNLPVQVVAPDALATTIWSREAAWGMVPFDRLDKTLKGLNVDSMSIFDRALDMNRWPLKETFGLLGDVESVSAATGAINAAGRWTITNRDLSRLTLLIMTGVTALTRATAYQMELDGINTPARDIAPFLADGDIVHTSNEVAFATDCPYPDPDTQSLRFCSDVKYFELLKTIRLGVVELTGNHVNDWGTAALLNSLTMYDAANMAYYGGGRNTEDARKALLITHNGNNLAFIGCNPVGPPGAWAKADRPGAAQCDDAFLAVEIPRLRAAGYLVVMTIQYQELYEYGIPAAQRQYFRKYARMGAQIVMGSQAHQPQGFGFSEDTFIHYGIGNLFFDQMWSVGTRQMFADKLILYDGRHIGTVLFTGLLEDFSRPRPMTEAERAAFLGTIFAVSDW